MKGCLKSPLLSSGSENGHIRKCVAFGADGSEEVHIADVWDRTPTEPARKLSYQDLLELKEIQRSLPRANQLADPISGRPASHYLSTVPIGLLPLLPDVSLGGSQDSSATNSPVTSPPQTPTGIPDPVWSRVPQVKERATPQPWHPPHLAHLLPSKPPVQRQKPKFAFLPLLETPPPSEPTSPFTSNPPSRTPSPEPSDTDHSLDPPTPSLTNASLDSSPLSRASSSSPEPSDFHLPPPRRNYDSKTHFGGHHDFHYSSSDEGYYSHHTVNPLYTISSMRLGDAGLNPSLDVIRQQYGHNVHPDKNNVLGEATPIQRQRRRNVIEINGIEIELDDDEDSCVDAPGTSGKPCTQDSLPISSSSTPSTAPSSPMTPRSTSPENLPSLPSDPTRPLSPIRISSPSMKCTKSLHSPIRFKRDKGPMTAAV